MRLPEGLLKAAVFLTVEDSGQYLAAGTAFFLATRDPYCLYLVTARHCVRYAERYGRLGVGLNTNDGRKAALWIDEGQWYFPDNEADDVAVFPVDLNVLTPEYDVLPLFIEQFGVTAEVIKRHQVGVGDELAIVGLFTQSVGTSRLRPVVRTGVIAAMPDEPLQDSESGLAYNAYLSEVRSIGGLSGSPVFLILSPGRVIDNDIQPEVRVIYLLGLVRGHFVGDTEGYAAELEAEVRQLNTGIAIVTPIQRAIDIIMTDPDIARIRRKASEAQAGWTEKA